MAYASRWGPGCRSGGSAPRRRNWAIDTPGDRVRGGGEPSPELSVVTTRAGAQSATIDSSRAGGSVNAEGNEDGTDPQASQGSRRRSRPSWGEGDRPCPLPPRRVRPDRQRARPPRVAIRRSSGSDPGPSPPAGRGTHRLGREWWRGPLVPSTARLHRQGPAPPHQRTGQFAGVDHPPRTSPSPA